MRFIHIFTNGVGELSKPIPDLKHLSSGIHFEPTTQHKKYSPKPPDNSILQNSQYFLGGVNKQVIHFLNEFTSLIF